MTEHLRVQGWRANPHQLLSWFAMDKVSVGSLATAIMVLETIKCGWQNAKPLGDPSFSTGPRYLQEEERGATATDLAMVEQLLGQVGLPTSAQTVNEFRGMLLNWRIAYFAYVSAVDVVARIEEIERNIRREMSTILFMYIAADRAKRYDLPEPFGGDVAASFPSASFDLQESGNCYTAARFTACVFHLMRALEIGLTAFATEFKITMSNTNWQPIIDQIESKIRDLGKAPGKSSAEKAKHEFYSQAATFMFLKDAWRNYTMHVRGKYTELEADTMYRNVGAFLQKLADGGIHE